MIGVSKLEVALRTLGTATLAQSRESRFFSHPFYRDLELTNLLLFYPTSYREYLY